MQKFLLSAAVAVGLMAAGPQAHANDIYFNLFSGGAILQSDDNAFDYAAGGGAGFENEGGLIFGGAIGMTVFDNLRAEVEVSFSQFDDLNTDYSTIGTLDVGSSVEALFFLANAWYDFDMGHWITPYIGGGIGGAWTEALSANAGGFGPEDTDTGFAFQAGAGVRMPLIQNVDLDLSYRFKGVVGLDYSSLEGAAGQWSDGELYIHALTAGLTVHFGNWP